MEFRYELFQPLKIFCPSPFILFDTISLPVHQVFKFFPEHLTVQNMFDFVFFNSIAYYWSGKILLMHSAMVFTLYGLSRVTERPDECSRKMRVV